MTPERRQEIHDAAESVRSPGIGTIVVDTKAMLADCEAALTETEERIAELEKDMDDVNEHFHFGA